MKVFTKLFTIVVLSLLSLTGNAQGYKTAIGIRGGIITPGLTIKHFIKDDAALEGIVATRYRGFSFTLLYEKHKSNAFEYSQLAWYYGAGGHVASYDQYYYGYYKNGSYYRDGFHGNVLSLGINGIVGLEYHFEEIPFTHSLDAMPYFDFVFRGRSFLDLGLSFRYVF